MFNVIIQIQKTDLLKNNAKKHDLVVNLFRCPECIFPGKNETGLKNHMAANHKESVNSSTDVDSSLLVAAKNTGFVLLFAT